MKYRDKKNAERTNRAATYNRHKAYGNAKAYRDAMNAKRRAK
jgi:hypothetical protein